MRFVIKVIFFCCLFLSATGIVAAQDSSVVKWSADIKKTSANEYEITLDGEIRNGWYLYNRDSIDELNGPVIGLREDVAAQGPIKLISSPASIPDQIFEKKEKAVFKNQLRLIQKIILKDTSLSGLKLALNYEVADGSNFLQEESYINLKFDGRAENKTALRILIPSIDINHPQNNCGDTENTAAATSSKGYAALFLIGFLGGLLALLTPCVFPMIPLTVSFFTKKSATKKAGVSNAFLYGFFILLIYILLSLPFHFLDSVNPELLNNISTNVYLNIFFFIIFIFFAFSFFGFYEITLPSSFSIGTDSKAGTGNMVGIFFMALTLAIVSFSCTGPILGSLLAGSLSSNGGAMQLTAGMAGFGLALAMPFALFALFPQWLQSLPKSGGWLNTVKVVLGFMELALAIKFLSNADLVKHWGLLKREVFIGLWIIIGILTTVYLFGKLKFPHDSTDGKISGGRKWTALLFLAFTIYLLPGVTNTSLANLKLISGFPPPLYYSIYQKTSDCILGLNCSKDYEEGLQRARQENKPLLIDFTGYACVNCRRMEENVWSNPKVYKLMKENFVVVSLYVDDKKQLPVNRQFTYITKDSVQKEINTVGDLWSTFETENFMNNAQPLYAIINNEELLLTHPVGYTPDAHQYFEWLECGLKTFRNNKRK